MSINRNYQNFNLKYLGQNTGCNCCCNRNNQSAYSPFGIFGSGVIGQPQSSANNFFNPFGMMFGGFSPMFTQMFSFNPFGGFTFPAFNFTFPQFSSFQMMPKLEMPKFAFNPIFVKNPAKISETGKNDKSKEIGNSDKSDNGKKSSGNSNKTDVTLVSAQDKETVIAQMSNNDKAFDDVLKEKGVEYDAKVGHEVTTYALNKARNKSDGDCALFVSNAFEKTGNDIGRGDAHEKNDKIEELASDRFTKIKLDAPDDIRKLPAGSVVVYEKGACDYSETFGHVFIATGNGRGVSDFLEQNPRLTTADFNKVSIYIPTKKSTQA